MFYIYNYIWMYFRQSAFAITLPLIQNFPLSTPISKPAVQPPVCHNLFCNVEPLNKDPAHKTCVKAEMAI